MSAIDGRRYVAVQVGPGDETRMVGVAQWVDGEPLEDLVEAADASQLVPLFEELGRIAALIQHAAHTGIKQARFRPRSVCRFVALIAFFLFLFHYHRWGACPVIFHPIANSTMGSDQNCNPL